MTDINPWAGPTWNLTEQALYIRSYGLVMARARAHDAGTELGAKRPPAVVQSTAKAPVYIFNKRVTIGSTTPSGGVVWLDGVGAPSDAIGSDGNLYLDTSNGDVYEKASGSWS